MWGGAPQDGWTPLFVAANNSHFAVVELLVAKGADTNVVLNVSGAGWKAKGKGFERAYILGSCDSRRRSYTDLL